ncbi:hypothetical protein [Bifidobacterium oedipodis]|uniref:Uncharacterized protein n=1 Tax=Bifidobacterium oedipodis TaxID=2675322 RepID=A0A7Y0EQ31_9BIFI|nr:hypothetical protein [Bifidobacterium sp. DSM 109957]NMM93928.1 hypothetical protein [Bifidobacterium sp. DSM 109957]
MSYDVYVAHPDVAETLLDKCCGEWEEKIQDYSPYDPCYYGVRSHITSNYSRLLTAYNVHPLDDMDGHTGKEVAAMVNKAFEEMDKTPQYVLEDLYFRDKDGLLITWGSVKECGMWLLGLKAYCERHEDYKVWVRV